jgi:hypothetical protein
MRDLSHADTRAAALIPLFQMCWFPDVMQRSTDRIDRGERRADAASPSSLSATFFKHIAALIVTPRNCGVADCIQADGFACREYAQFV